MKLFICTNEKTSETNLIKMLEVSVKSALKNTNFEVNVIFDGDPKKLNLPSNVNIIKHRHRCYNVFENSNRCKNSEPCLTTASGAFLRTEIPYLMNELGCDDEYCFYTDYDVIFLENDFSELEKIKTNTFASAPEFHIDNWGYCNTGAMLMNAKNFIQEDSKIVDYIKNNFETLHTWDQTLYNSLYHNNFTKLPVEFNWKPYWGINKDAKIVHFHGVKPFSVNPIEQVFKQPILKNLYDRNPNSYEYYNKLFESFL
jgi:hypothetical protein